MKFWWMLLIQVIQPSVITYLIMFIPALILIGGIVVAATRAKPGPSATNPGVWAALGSRWLGIGLAVLAATVILYGIGVYYGYRNDLAADFTARLQRQAAADTTDDKQAIADLVGFSTDADGLRQMATDYVALLAPEARFAFVDAAMLGMTLGPRTFYEPLYWSQEKIRDYQASHQGQPPQIVGQGLNYTAAQQPLFAANRFADLQARLDENQWMTLTETMLDGADLAGLRQILIAAAAALPDSDRQALRQDLEQRCFTDSAARLAWLAGDSERAGALRTATRYVNYLRDSPYLLVYLVIAGVLICRGAYMKREGERTLFVVESAAGA